MGYNYQDAPRESQQEYFGRVHTDNKETLQNALKRIEELEGQVTRAFEVLEGKRKRIEELEQENTRLKLELEALDGQIPWKDIKDKSEVLGKLTKAKELLKQFLKAKNGEDTYKAEWEAEQFLKEIK